jgi:uncharacterized protein YdaU (DUF1376 family)
MHYYQHHIGDFIRATSRLTDSQAMAYLRLIWIYYDKNGVVENDPKQLAFEIGSDVETVALMIKTYFEVDGDFIRQSRCDRELVGYLNKSKGGKLGADKRWGKRDRDSLPIANPMPPQCDPNANQEPITNNQKPNINTPDGVSESVFKDYLEVRKTKKAKWSDTALKGLVKEAEKAGISLQEAMELCCARGWVGFKAEWIKDQYPKKQETGTSALAELFMQARGHDVKQIT